MRWVIPLPCTKPHSRYSIYPHTLSLSRDLSVQKQQLHIHAYIHTQTPHVPFIYFLSFPTIPPGQPAGGGQCLSLSWYGERRRVNMVWPVGLSCAGARSLWNGKDVTRPRPTTALH